MRCGSVVARMALQPTERPYTDIHAHCLFYSRGTCGKCARRCPVGAITEEGHDKGKCAGYLGGVTSPYIREHYGLEIYSCGLCQTQVPCESGIPPKLQAS
jgi:epoxyqueuosine reductase